MANVYNRGKFNLGTGVVDWLTTDIGVLLVTSTYTYDADHNFVSDITNELSGGGYARQTGIGGKTVTENDASDRVEYDATDVTFPTLGAAAGNPDSAIIYDNTTGLDTTRPLLARIPLTAPPVPNGGDYVIRWDATGLFQLGE